MEHLDFSSLNFNEVNPIIVQGNDGGANPVKSLSGKEMIHDILCEQMHKEEYNARAYYQVYLLLKQSGYKCAGLWHKFYLEELDHAKKIEEYLIDLNAKNIELHMIPFDSKDISCSTIHDAILSTMMLEEKNYENLVNAYKQISEINDDSCRVVSMRLLEEMLREQFEEKRKSILLQQYSLRTNDILQLDEYLASLI